MPVLLTIAFGPRGGILIARRDEATMAELAGAAATSTASGLSPNRR
jgi:hypothetical protein